MQAKYRTKEATKIKITNGFQKVVQFQMAKININVHFPPPVIAIQTL